MNERLRQAILSVRIFGKSAETMGELYDSLNARREFKVEKLASDKEFSAFMNLCR